MLNTILRSKIDTKHLIFRSIAFGVLTFLIMRYLIIFLIWGFVGEGAYPRIWDTYINIFYALSGIIFLYPVIFFRIRINYMKRNFSKAKDYLIICFIVILISVIISYNEL